MTTATIINAAPMHIMLGTQDLSTRAVDIEPERIPTHLPKVYIYAKRGPTTPQLVVGASRTQMYGEDTFDLHKKWANHATLYSNMFNAAGNAQMIERVVPDDIGPVANVLLSLEVLETTIDLYKRLPDGSYETDPVTLEPVVVGKTRGYQCKWITSTIDKVQDIENFGHATIKTGTKVGKIEAGLVPPHYTGTGNPTSVHLSGIVVNPDQSVSTQSKIYPIMEFRASSVGEDGNRTGVRIWSPTDSSNYSFDSRIMPRAKVYPFRMAVVRKEDGVTTAKVKETIYGEQNVLVSFKEHTTNPITTGPLSLDDVFLDSYQNIKDHRYPVQLGDFGDVKVYHKNIELLLNTFYQTEVEYLKSNPTVSSDFNTDATDEAYMFNIIGGHNFNGWKYNTFQLDKAGVLLSPVTNIFNQSGSDGTMNDELFAKLVESRVSEYGNPNSELMENAVHVESVIYDSGFPLETKYKLLNFISQRKDTFVFLSTFEHGKRRLTPSEDTSTAIALRTRAEFYPESDYFGTPVMRAYIQGRSAKIRTSTWRHDVSPLYSIGKKLSNYMGSGNGKWKIGGGIGGAPNSVIEDLTDFSNLFTPALARNRDWEAGLNWVMHFDRKDVFIPATKTVYNNDTSVLNSVTTVLAICELQKIADRAWRYFSGVDNLTNGQLKERCEAFILNNIEGKFDSRFVIEPEVYFTDSDIQRGYSWSLRIKIYAANMKTVMTSHITAYRMSDLVKDK